MKCISIIGLILCSAVVLFAQNSEPLCYQTAIETIETIKSQDVKIDTMSVQVIMAYDATFQKKIFRNGSICFPNRTNILLMDIPDEFSEYEYLANDATILDQGIIIPGATGYIYAFAYPGNESNMVYRGWEKEDVKTFGFWDGKIKTDLCIYRKYVLGGTENKIPEIVNFAGCTPLAKRVKLDTTITETKGITSSNFFFSEAGIIKVQLNDKSPFDLSIINLQGYVLQSYKQITQNKKIDISYLKKGLYILLLKQNGNIYSEIKYL